MIVSEGSKTLRRSELWSSDFLKNSGQFDDSPPHSFRSFLRRTHPSVDQVRSEKKTLPSKSYAGALEWIYAQPDVDTKRARDWLKSCSEAECMLRVALKRPLAKELPTDGRSGPDFRSKQLSRLHALIARASKVLPSNAPILQAGRNRLEKIRRLPMVFETAEQHVEKARSLAEQVIADEELDKEREAVMRPVSQFQRHCDCGEQFKDDALYCRKCGAERREIFETTVASESIPFCQEEETVDKTIIIPGTANND